MDQKPKIFTFRVIVQLLLFVIIVPCLPLLISRDWSWWEAWAYAILSILGFAVSRRLAARRHPDLIAERARSLQHEDAKEWDKKLAPLFSLASILIMVVAGFDQLYGWSPAFSRTAKILALILILAGYAFSSYALIENRFFSGVVRIQTERGHKVVSSGPYRWVRHPGYTGGLLASLATPILLDSSWAMLPAIFLTIVLVKRTDLEDKTLHNELEGYREYARRVRFRLIPGVW